MEGIDIPAACDRALLATARKSPRYANRASDIGDDCTRRLCYERVNWEAKRDYDVGLLYVFETGKRLEDPVIRQIQDAGFKVIRQQEAFQHKEGGEVLLTGHIDAIIEHEGKRLILEVKSSNEHIWEKLTTAADFALWPWTRKYAPQLNAYCFGLEIPDALWIFVNKSNGRLKQIQWQLDYGMAEATLKRCQEINAHVKAGSLPPHLPNTPESAKICEDCPFLALCQPPINRDSLELIVKPELIAMIAEHFDLEAPAGRYEQLKTILKDEKLAGIKKAAIGPYLYDGSKRTWKARWTKP